MDAHTQSHTSCVVLGPSRLSDRAAQPHSSSKARSRIAAMQAHAYPAFLPGAGCRSGLLLTRSVSGRSPAGRGVASSVRAVDGASAAAAVAAAADCPLPPAQVTWQIVVGAVAGVTPFVVAGVEFGKRIVAQKKCEVCGGSGLVMKNDNYVRCQGCGGFLPWQSWRRFFTG